MNLIDQRFQLLREQQRTALIPFITVGDPDYTTTIDIIKELEAAGADMVELGVPYSDPLADGAVIQRASGRALLHHINVLDCIRAGQEARAAGVTLPFILFTYYNPILQAGLEKIFGLLADSGFSGIIVPDLPMEEDSYVRKLSLQYDIHLIPLVAPTSNDRIINISRKASGFVYCVSSLGVTGVRSDFYGGIEDFIATVRSATDLPLAVGFGISNHEQFARFSKLCDGVVVGSAIVRQIEEVLPLLAESTSRKEGLLEIRSFVSELRG